MGAAILQKYDGRCYLIEYYSHKIIMAEFNYAPHDHELPAIFIYACEWRYHIDGS